MQSIKNIREYLGLADIDYLSARLLILNGMPTVGLAKAAESIEKQFKLFFLLYEKITNNNDLNVKNMKKYGHNLVEMLDSYNKIVPKQKKLDNEWKEYLTIVQDAYDRRYPEHWKEWEVKIDVGQLDKAYTYMRNNNAANFPDEYKERALVFGTFLSDIYQDDEYISKIQKRGLLPPMEILKLENDSYNDLQINKNA